MGTWYLLTYCNSLLLILLYLILFYFLDLKSVFKEYLTNGTVQADTIILAKMCAYFIFYGISYPIDDKSICKFLQVYIFFVFALIRIFLLFIFLPSEFSYDNTVLF